MRIPGYDEFKVGDEFRVPVLPSYIPDNAEILKAVMTGEVPKSCIIEYDHYMRLESGDKFLRRE